MIDLTTNIKVEFDAEISNPKHLKVRRSDFNVAKPNGQGWVGRTYREYLLSRNAVAGIIYEPNEEKILMMRQFRYPIYAETKSEHLAWIYETVAGLIDKGEDPLDTFVRETKEETGLTIKHDDVKFETKYYVSPGFVDEQHFIYTATVDKIEDPNENPGLDTECEAIIAKWQSYDEIIELIKGTHDKDGNLHKIMDGKTLVALSKMGLS